MPRAVVQQIATLLFSAGAGVCLFLWWLTEPVAALALCVLALLMLMGPTTYMPDQPTLHTIATGLLLGSAVSAVVLMMG